MLLIGSRTKGQIFSDVITVALFDATAADKTLPKESTTPCPMRISYLIDLTAGTVTLTLVTNGPKYLVFDLADRFIRRVNDQIRCFPVDGVPLH